MFEIPPAAPEIDDLQPISDAIDELCEVLEGNREAVIEELAEIIRRRAAFEHCRQACENDGEDGSFVF
ncbi:MULTISPECIES: hypothetical protein [unclassified Methylobacterium]|jgi:hypothetical protein|uniref:hypothetical protein n=1 Tax=unclassified Methylobacterium TaxID=2615210 RepID=UPI0009F5666F|nr:MULTISPECIES: hypothetical protein [unclassified Methylobacterium]RUP22664.1 MAG: hypothetical protein EKK44_03805 [Methylobacterium sp.]